MEAVVVVEDSVGAAVDSEADEEAVVAEAAVWTEVVDEDVEAQCEEEGEYC